MLYKGFNHTLFALILIISSLTPVYAFKYSEDLAVLDDNIQPPSNKRLADINTTSCNTTECADIRNKISKLSGEIAEYDNKILNFLTRFNDPEIVKLKKEATSYEDELSNTTLSGPESFRLNQQLQQLRKDMIEMTSAKEPSFKAMILKTDVLLTKKSELELKLKNAALQQLMEMNLSTQQLEEIEDNQQNQIYPDDSSDKESYY